MSLGPVLRLKSAASVMQNHVALVTFMSAYRGKNCMQELTLLNLVLVCGVKVDAKIQAVSVEINKLSKLL